MRSNPNFLPSHEAIQLSWYSLLIDNESLLSPQIVDLVAQHGGNVVLKG